MSKVELPGELKRLVRRFLALIAVVFLADFVFGAMYVQHMVAIGMSPALIGVAFAVAIVLSTVVETPSGAWGDRYGNRRMAVAGLAMWGLSLVLFSQAGQAWAVIVALVAQFVGRAIYSGAPMTLVLNQIPEDQPDARAVVVKSAQVTRWGAAALGAASVGLFGAHLPVATMVLICGVAMTATAVWVQMTWSRGVVRAAGDGPTVVGHIVTGVRFLGNAKQLVVLVLTLWQVAMFSIMVFAWQPVVVAEFGLADTQLGWTLLVLSVATALGAVASRWVKDVTTTWLVGASVGMAASLAVASLGGAFTVIGYLAAEFLCGVLGTMLAVRSNAMFPDAQRNTLLSLYSTLSGLVMALTDQVFGLLWNGNGIMSALLVGTALATGSAVLGLAAVAAVNRARSCGREVTTLGETHG